MDRSLEDFRLYAESTATVLELRGDLDLGQCRHFTEALGAAARLAPDRRLIVSFADCRHCDCANLGTLVTVRNRLGRQLGLVIPEANPVRRLFDILDLTQPFRVSATLSDALAHPWATSLT